MGTTRQFLVVGMLCLLSCLGVCGGIAGIGYFAFGEAPAQIELDNIAEHYQQGEITRSRAELLDYIQRYPTNDLAWTLLGHMYQQDEAYAEAEKAYLKAVELNPNAYVAYTNLGVLARKRGDTEQGFAYYTKALEVNPDYAQAATSLATIALERGDYTKALELAEKAYHLDNEDPIIAANLAVIYHYNGNYRDRDRLFDVASDLGYDNLERLQELFEDDARLSRD